MASYLNRFNFIIFCVLVLFSEMALSDQTKCCSNGSDYPFNQKQIKAVVNRAIKRHERRQKGEKVVIKETKANGKTFTVESKDEKKWAKADAWLADHAKRSRNEGYLVWKITHRQGGSCIGSCAIDKVCKHFAAKTIAGRHCGGGTVKLRFTKDDYQKRGESKEAKARRRVRKLLEPHGLVLYYDKGLIGVQSNAWNVLKEWV